MTANYWIGVVARDLISLKGNKSSIFLIFKRFLLILKVKYIGEIPLILVAIFDLVKLVQCLRINEIALFSSPHSVCVVELFLPSHMNELIAILDLYVVYKLFAGNSCGFLFLLVFVDSLPLYLSTGANK